MSRKINLAAVEARPSLIEGPQLVNIAKSLGNTIYFQATTILDMWYQVTGDAKYYVFDHVGTVYQATTSAQRDALLESLRTISIEDILNDNA